MGQLKDALEFLEFAREVTTELIKINEQQDPEDAFLSHFFQVQMEEVSRDGTHAIGEALRDSNASDSQDFGVYNSSFNDA